MTLLHHNEVVTMYMKIRLIKKGCSLEPRVISSYPSFLFVANKIPSFTWSRL